MEFLLALPLEMTLALGCLVFLTLSLMKTVSASTTRTAALVMSSLALLVALATLGLRGTFFGSSLLLDSYSQPLKAAVAAGLLLTVILSRRLTDTEESERPEFFLFLFSSSMGLSLILSAADLILFYIALELASYSLYLLVPMRRRQAPEQEASLKYFLFGAVSSGLMLFGLSYLYGASGSLLMSQALGGALTLPGLSFLGLILVLTGIAFKLAIVPFHFWAPDVYERTPAPLVAFIATVSKVGVIGAFLRILLSAQGATQEHLTGLFLILSVVTMTWGNFAALRQRDAKRMLAYSSISQVGYLLVGLVGAAHGGFEAVIFYTLLYLIMNFGAFLVLSLISEPGRDPKLEDFTGLAKRAPFLAFVFLISVFSLAGIPPLAGFAGKWVLFKSALDSGFVWLVIWAMVNSTVSLYYYLLFVKEAYLGETKLPPLHATLLERLLGLVLVALVVILGIWPTPAYDLAFQALAGLGH